MLKPRKNFKPEKQGRKTGRPYYKGDSFNYDGETYRILTHPREYINEDGNIVVYCKVDYYDTIERKDKTCYAVEVWL